MKKLSIIIFSIFCLLTISVFTACEDSAEGIVHDLVNESEHTGVNVSISSFGSPNVSGAKEDSSVQIKGLKINGRSGMSYSWAAGSLKNWGLADNQADAIAVMGYSSDGKTYKCAKFDWISTSRHSRDFNNLNSGYNGWKPEEFYAAKKHCFFIMSKDGKKRTNIITD